MLDERTTKLVTKVQKPLEPIDGHYKICRRVTKQKTTELAKLAIDLFETAQEPSESIEDYYAPFNEQKYAIKEETMKCSSEVFLVRLFIRMTDDER